MILFTEETCPSVWDHGETYVWLIDLGNSQNIKRARQEMKTKLLAMLPNECTPRTTFSYTSHYMTMAVSFSDAVGVDIEDTRRVVDFDGIAAHVLTPTERQSMQTPGDFYLYWTAKEAALKAIGKGFAFDPLKVSFRRQGEGLYIDEIEGYPHPQFQLDSRIESPIRLTLCRFEAHRISN